MVIKAYPKVNLALDILGKDPKTGFHFIETVLYEVKGDMFDEMEIEEISKGIEVVCDNKDVPLDKQNTVWRAVDIMMREWRKCRHRKKTDREAEIQRNATGRSRQKGIRVIIKKRIPMQSGLGGASSDAAAVLKTLNKLWKLKFSSKKLENIAAQIGMDVPFFIRGGCSVAIHFGEIVTRFNRKPHLQVKIINTDKKVDTKLAYKDIEVSRCGKNHNKTRKLISAIRQNDKKEIIKNIHNDFEILSDGRKPQKAHLCGSGGCRFKILSGH